MNDELLPCPFCGGKAALEGFDAPEYWVWCLECRASTDTHTCKQPAIDAWNKRVKRYPESLAQRMIADGYEHELFELRKERDEIKAEHEAEIADKYLELPIDVYGRPIHVGDKVFWYAVGYFDVIGIGEQVVLDKGDSRYAIVWPDVLEVVEP